MPIRERLLSVLSYTAAHLCRPMSKRMMMVPADVWIALFPPDGGVMMVPGAPSEHENEMMDLAQQVAFLYSPWGAKTREFMTAEIERMRALSTTGQPLSPPANDSQN